ncbi:hypothetical protein ACOME3_010465 [Neoechinorhynchus agilis]
MLQKKKCYIETPFVDVQWNSGIDSLINRIDRDKACATFKQKGRTLQGILRPKNEEVPVGCVYKISCSNYNLSYVGQTINLKRIAEHRRAVDKKTDVSSPIVSHINSSGHAINFDGTEVLARTDVKRDRVTIEAIMIQRTNTFPGNKADYKLNLRIPPINRIKTLSNLILL